jgi:hypothetical protein
MDEILLKDVFEGEEPTSITHRTFQPSQDDQHSTHAVQETVLFISQLVYSWME